MIEAPIVTHFWGNSVSQEETSCWIDESKILLTGWKKVRSLNLKEISGLCRVLYIWDIKNNNATQDLHIRPVDNFLYIDGNFRSTGWDRESMTHEYSGDLFKPSHRMWKRGDIQ